MAHHLFEALVRSIQIFKLDIEHGIDPVLARKRIETVFPAVAGKNCTVVESTHAIEIEFRRPPSCSPILHLQSASPKPAPAIRFTRSPCHLELEISRFF